MGRTEARISLADVNGQVVWAKEVQNIGTDYIMSDYWEMGIFGEYDPVSETAPDFDTYIDKVVITDNAVVPEPASFAALAMGMIGAAGTVLRRRSQS
jgi:hypothetical protein